MEGNEMILTDRFSDKTVHGFIRDFHLKFQNPEELLCYIQKQNDHSEQSPDFTLATGLSGLLVLASQLRNQDEEWDNYAFKILNYMIDSLPPLNLSLWGGLTGIAASTYLVSDEGKYYTNFLKQLNDVIISNTSDYLQQARRNLEDGRVNSFDFETIYGLAGIGRYLLNFKEDQEVNRIIKDILDYFILLNGKKDFNGLLLPQYFITEGNQYIDDETNYPGGHLDLGLSHGICGPLAFLSISLENGFDQSNQTKTIEDMCEFLIRWGQEDAGGLWWPSKINLQELSTNQLQTTQKYPFAWCYGTPGVARTLWLSGRALHNDRYKEIALTTFKSLSKYPFEDLRLTSPTFCHGVSGLLHLTFLMHLETNDKELYQFLQILRAKLLRYYNPENPLGFYDIDHNGLQTLSVGALEGTSGIIATLNAIEQDQKPSWSSLFLVD
jgi:hypothetical protein